MGKLAGIIVGLLGVLPLHAQAALPPQYQRIVEFRALFESAEVAQALPHNQFIERVEYIGPDHYRISTPRCVLDIGIVGKPLPEGMVGARQFDLKIGKAACTPE